MEFPVLYTCHFYLGNAATSYVIHTLGFTANHLRVMNLSCMNVYLDLRSCAMTSGLGLVLTPRSDNLPGYLLEINGVPINALAMVTTGTSAPGREITVDAFKQ